MKIYAAAYFLKYYETSSFFCCNSFASSARASDLACAQLSLALLFIMIYRVRRTFMLRLATVCLHHSIHHSVLAEKSLLAAEDGVGGDQN